MTTKKSLKDEINNKGFFMNMPVNVIKINDLDNEMKDGFSTNAIKTGKKTPKGDNIMIFKGLASQNYKKGEKSRNGYKIDVNGWDFTNYLYNPIMLRQHNDEYGGIGHALMFEVTSEGLNILFYIDLNSLDARNRYQIENGLVSAISTGHLTKEDGIEDVETGTVYNIEDAIEKYGIYNVYDALRGDSNTLTYVVTKAEALENSIVTIGSNEKAGFSLQNAIGKYATNKYEYVKDMYNEEKNKEPLTAVQENNTSDTKEPEVTTITTEEETDAGKQTDTKEVNDNVEKEVNENVVITDEEEVNDTVEQEVQQDTQETKDDTQEEVQEEVKEEATEKLEKEGEIVREEVDTNTVVEVTSENKVEITLDKQVSSSISVDKAEFETMNNTINSLKEEIELLKEDNKAKELLLEQGQTMLIEQNSMIEKAKNYQTKLGLAFSEDGIEVATVTNKIQSRVKRVS